MWSFGDAVVLSGGCSLLIHKGGESCRATCTWDLRYEIICEVDLQQERQGQSLEQMMQTRRQKQKKENSTQDTRARTSPMLSWVVNVKMLLFYTWNQFVSWPKISPRLLSAPTVVLLNRKLNWSTASSNLFSASWSQFKSKLFLSQQSEMNVLRCVVQFWHLYLEFTFLTVLELIEIMVFIQFVQ